MELAVEPRQKIAPSVGESKAIASSIGLEGLEKMIKRIPLGESLFLYCMKSAGVNVESLNAQVTFHPLLLKKRHYPV